ncbi:dissimilatory adenylylsulfate reductase beta subunit [Natranaerovirga hydrolytica]|uniref:Dissimilatory adenylylsulfate reductase beta subunit n=1 Tax=Natranaerovirga hydrolytica TaxID=680378 RepID=A0A4R1MIK4_9FIRM|nr:4Fe-4S binding protein [Natranaerovirga hydrolytica]TCK92476.1 dissimilatory adenylylsulfate reductase beta subunit [Natranaerovirga hydrolytica]
MSIHINKSKCIGCKKCFHICPGNLISEDKDKKAAIDCPKSCWGCTACIKECPTGAIEYFLGLDIGGKGGHLKVEEKNDTLNWHITTKDNEETTIQTKKNEANTY